MLIGPLLEPFAKWLQDTRRQGSWQLAYWHRVSQPAQLVAACWKLAGGTGSTWMGSEPPGTAGTVGTASSASEQTEAEVALVDLSCHDPKTCGVRLWCHHVEAEAGKVGGTA